MKKYIVVKTNLMRKQKFYLRRNGSYSWSVKKEDAHKYLFRWTAAKIAKQMNAGMSDCWKGIIEHGVEEVE